MSKCPELPTVRIYSQITNRIKEQVGALTSDLVVKVAWGNPAMVLVDPVVQRVDRPQHKDAPNPALLPSQESIHEGYHLQQGQRTGGGRGEQVAR